MESEMPAKFHVYVELVAIPGTESDLLESLEALCRASLATDLCSRFAVSVAHDNSLKFHLFETFTSKSIYPEHVATAHAQYFLTVVLPNYVAERTVIFLEDSLLTS